MPGQVGSFPVAFVQKHVLNAYVNALYINIMCRAMSVHKNATGKLPTCPDHSKGVYTCLNTVHTEVILVYDSIVHTSYMGCTDRHTWKWYTQIISSTHVQRYVHVYTPYERVYAMYVLVVHGTYWI